MYDLYYSLNGRPFASKPDPKYFHTSSSHKQALLHMHIGLDKTDGIIVLTGDKGTGKTSLITHVMRQQDRNHNVIASFSSPPQSDHEFLPAILTALGIPNAIDATQSSLISTLCRFMLDQAKSQKKVILIFDNAHALTNNGLEFIHQLASLRLGDRGLLQVILVGSNELNTRLTTNENRGLSKLISVAHRLQALSLPDTRKYIEHRLNVANWKVENLAIEEEVFNAIHDISAGVPSAINLYFDRLLMVGFLRRTHHISAKDVSALTASNMDKLDKLEANWQAADIRTSNTNRNTAETASVNSDTRTSIPAQQVANESHTGKNSQAIPSKKPTRFFNRQTLTTAVAVYLISTASVFFFGKISANNSAVAGATHAEAKTHESNSHNTSELTVGHHGGNSTTVKYVLDDMPAEFIHTTATENGPESHLLDLQQLLTKSSKIEPQVSNDKSKERLASYMEDSSPDSIARIRQPEHSGHHTPEVAYSMD